MFAGKVWHSELHQKGKVENESLGAPWTGEEKRVKSVMGFPFHSLIFCSSRHESGEKKPQTPQNQISCLDCFKQRFVWVDQDTANVLPCLFLENLQVFTLETLRPLHRDEQAAWDAGMLRRFCTLGTRALPWPPRVPPRVGRARVSPPSSVGPDSELGGHLLSHSPALGSTWLAPEVSQPAPSRPWPVGAGRSKEITAGARGDMATGHHLT